MKAKFIGRNAFLHFKSQEHKWSVAQHQLWFNFEQVVTLISTGSKVTEYQSLLYFIPKVFEDHTLHFFQFLKLDG